MAGDLPVIVNCSRIAFIDSAGLQVLAEARLVAEQSHDTFQLSSIPEPVRRVLELSGTTPLFDAATGPVESWDPSWSRDGSAF